MKKYIIPLLILFFSLASVAQEIDTIKVKVHDHVMTLYASGAGSPAVILEAGGASNHKTWDSVRTKLSKLSKVIAYDRPGYLNSDTCSSSRDALTVAKELREGLIKAGIKPSYVLAGWSMGGAFVRVFAGLYPKDVVGLVLVDPAPEESYARFDKEFPELMAEDAKYMQEILTSKTRIGEREEMRFFDSSMNQARRSDAQHATLIYLLIAAGKAPGGQDRDPSNPLNRIWIEELEKWAMKRPNLKYEIIRNSGHHIARFQPDTVVHAIRDVVTQWQFKQLKQSVSAYKKPGQLKDGIKTATLKDVNINENLIQAMTDSIVNGVYPNIHSVLILRNNKLVYEHYFPGTDFIVRTGKPGFKNHHRDTLHDQRSITKSVVSAAMLISVDQQKIKSLDERVFVFFPEYVRYDTGMKRDITIKHLLTMSAGLEWDEEISYSDQRNSEIRMNRSPDPIEFVLSQKVVDIPGTRFTYSGGCTQILAAIVEKVTGIPVDKFSEQFLFKPLGIKNYTWVKNRAGNPSAASGLRLRSRDMAKFGLLYMNNGLWESKRILPSVLVNESLKMQIQNNYGGGYGYQFWLWPDTVLNQPIVTVQAQGNGGQRIAMNKKYNLVIVTTAGNYNTYIPETSSDALYLKFIYPAVIKGTDKTLYKKPAQINDGIQTATLKEVGVDEKLIHAMTDSITTGKYTNVHSVLISRYNKLAYEQYWPGEDEVRMKGKVGFVPHHRDSLHDVRSITKSITSAAIMIAHAQGKIKNLNQRIFDFFPQFAKYDTGFKRQITIQHLLNMTAGMYWDEEFSYNDSLKKGTVSDAYNFILRQQVVSTPGSKFVYSSSYSQLLAAILEKATGMSIEKFTAKYLFHPLGITKYEWTVERNGLISAWAGLRMRSRDLLKFGMLYLNGGKWNGKQIIPAYGVAQSLKSGITTPHGDSLMTVGYSNQFWIYADKINGTPAHYAQANGNGGQIVVIDKQSNLVFVTTAGIYDKVAPRKSSWDLYHDFVFLAIVKNVASGNPIDIIKNLTHKAFEALFKQDTAAISGMMDEKFISIYPDKINNKQQELSGIYNYIKQMKSEGQLFDSFTLDDFQVRLYDSTAVATYYSNSKGRNKGVPFESRMQWYDVWTKQNGNWKMVASQGTSISK
jgi:CubicO group peptidase (beta-lactamase class C family)/pimeloyl-ACP methyl ester carboxylesterase